MNSFIFSNVFGRDTESYVCREDVPHLYTRLYLTVLPSLSSGTAWTAASKERRKKLLDNMCTGGKFTSQMVLLLIVGKSLCSLVEMPLEFVDAFPVAAEQHMQEALRLQSFADW